MSATFLGLWMAIGSMMYPHRPSPAGPMFTNCSEPITVVAPYQYEGYLLFKCFCPKDLKLL